MRDIAKIKRPKEYSEWMEAKYPYDNALCGHCATQHALNMCHQHEAMNTEAKRLGFHGYTQRNITKAVLRKVLSFRKQFAEFYHAPVKS